MWKRIVIIFVVALKVESAISEQTNKEVQLLINEIMFSTSKDWVEVYCIDDGNSGNGTQIKNFYLDDLDGNKDKTIGTCTIKTGEFLLLHYGIEEQDETYGINGKINIFTAKKYITSTTNQIVLYNASDKIIDAVCWQNENSSPNEEEDKNNLIKLGEWQGEAIDSTNVATGESIARKALLDTNSKDDWYTSISTLGLPNNMISQSVNLPEIKVVKIINKTFTPEEAKYATIIYSLSKPSQVSLRIYDIRGRLVKRLIEKKYISKEENTIIWDGKDEEGNILSIGVYICYLEAVNEWGASSDKATLILAKKL